MTVKILKIFHNTVFLCFLWKAQSAVSFQEKALLSVLYRCFDCYVSTVFKLKVGFFCNRYQKEELQGTGCKYFDITMKLKGKFNTFFTHFIFFLCRVTWLILSLLWSLEK